MGNLAIQRITSEKRRDIHDEELNDLISRLSTQDEEKLEELLHNFSPNLDGMSNQQIYRCTSVT